MPSKKITFSEYLDIVESQIETEPIPVKVEETKSFEEWDVDGDVFRDYLRAQRVG